MKYALMIFETEEDLANRPRYQPAYTAYADALAQAGVMFGGAALKSQHTGTTVRINDGNRSVQDGPYAETKEQLGGFFLIDVPDLDAALDWAARCPAASYCAVEIRPVDPMDEAQEGA